jgi:NADH-quinone oxidoreductase subunit N
MAHSTTLNDLLAVGPIGIITLTALLVVIVESIRHKTETVNFWLTLAGLAAAMAVAVQSLPTPGYAFGTTVKTGGFSSYFVLVFGTAALLSVLLSRDYVRKQGIEHGEYYVLLLIGVLGMMTMAASNDLVVFFLGLETMSIAFYVLAGFARSEAASNEAGLKYFLLGAFSTGFLLYGIALLYGASGTTNIEGIRAQLPLLAGTPLFTIGLGLMLVGLAFKVAAVPFHMWVPDVYEGAPTTVSGFLSTGGKAAAFSMFLLMFAPDVLTQVHAIRELIAAFAALSMIVGNVLAIAQTSVKRMLAYSSIAHAGYLLAGVVAANAPGGNGILFYLMAYTLMNIGAFGVLVTVETGRGENLRLEDFAGLSGQKPLAAGFMAVFMFSLAGIPPFAGFFGKYYVFLGAIQAGYTWLAILGVLMSVVSAFYYLRLVVLMYFSDTASTRTFNAAPAGLTALLVSALALLLLGLLPSTIVDVTSRFF